MKYTNSPEVEEHMIRVHRSWRNGASLNDLSYFQMKAFMLTIVLLTGLSCKSIKHRSDPYAVDMKDHLPSGQTIHVELRTGAKQQKQSGCTLPIYYVSKIYGYPNPYDGVQIRILNKNSESGFVSVSKFNERFLFTEWAIYSERSDTVLFRDDILERYRNQRYSSYSDHNEKPLRPDGLLLEFIDLRNIHSFTRTDTIWFGSTAKRRKACYELWMEYY